MKIAPTKLPEVLLIEPDVFPDQRGLFLESFHSEKYAGLGLPSQFVQDNFTRSKKDVIRGLHGQLKHPQGKLVRAVRGKIFDVAVDLRRGSPRFGQWVGQILSDANFSALYIPAGFFHGFAVLSDEADVLYKCTAHYNPADEAGVRWNDAALKIQWPVASPVLSSRDQNLPLVAELLSSLPDIKEFPSS
jgi:dTDP-4-dehydrorhamnose 3,5-epimerase